MTELDEIESLKADLKSLFKVVKDNEAAKVENAREELLSEIASLSAELGQDFDKEEFKEAPIDSLRFNLKVLRRTIEAAKAASGGDLAGMVNRGEPNKLTPEQLEDVLVDMISLAYGLPIADDETKELIRLERMAEGYKLR